jgi:hypothetical protein
MEICSKSGNSCKLCKKCFSSKYTLERHIKNEICTQFAGVVEFKCVNCDKDFSTKQNLNRHYTTCKVKRKQDEDANKRRTLEKEVFDIITKFEAEILQLNQKHNELVKKITHDYDIKIAKLENTIEIYELRCKEYKHQIDRHSEDYKEITIKAIENAGPKTNNTINNRNQIYQALQPLTEEHMKNQSQYLTFNNVKNGAHGIAHFASNHTFKDRIFCSDKSRLNFVFKNENDVIIKDPEGVEITKRFIEINREELLRLLGEYFAVIVEELDKDLDAVEYKYWSDKREEIITIRSAVKRGNIPENKDSYSSFKKGFLSALSGLVQR